MRDIVTLLDVVAAHSSLRTISVVIPALNEPLLERTVRDFEATLPAGSEIVVVDDGSTDGSTGFLTAADARVRLLHSDWLGPAGARNLGVRHSRGDALVFADAHTSVTENWWAPLLRMLENPAVGMVSPLVSDLVEPDCRGCGMRMTGPALELEWMPPLGDSPRPVPIIAGCFAATRRELFEAMGGFDSRMRRWGSEDLEMCLRLWLHGYEVWVEPQVEVGHLFREQHPYTVEWHWVMHNLLRTALLHFGSARIARVLEVLEEHDGFQKGLQRLQKSDVFARREQLAATRLHDDDWFFEKFGPDW